MILEYTCRNFKSIKEDIYFSMLANKDDTNEETLITFDNWRFVKTAAIYGANGSGKSNFIKSLKFLKGCVVNSIKMQPDDEINVMPHRLMEDEPAKFAIQFVKDEIRYAYGVVLTKECIHEEFLYVFPYGRKAKVFEREFDKLSIGDSYKKDLELARNALKSNRLFLSCAANFSNVDLVEQAFRFFKSDLIFYTGHGKNNSGWLKITLEMLAKHEGFKALFIQVLNTLDRDLRDVLIDYNEEEVAKDEIPEQLFSETLRKNDLDINDIEKIRKVSAKADLVYEQFMVHLEEESEGTKRLFELLGPFVDIIMEGKILLWDEIETSLHPVIVRELVEFFNTAEESAGQMVFTTHDTNLLDLSLLRRDQIWFTELKRDVRATDMYSLIELKKVRKDENIRKGYMAGKYGAIPIINESINNLFK